MSRLLTDDPYELTLRELHELYGHRPEACPEQLRPWLKVARRQMEIDRALALRSRGCAGS